MFDQHFEAILADNDEAKRIHYNIRYQVYCLEAGYEDPNAFADGEEKDQWDEHAAHFLVRSKATGQWIAAMRLILPVGSRSHPVFQFCDIDPCISHLSETVMTGEVSRLCVLGTYRRRLAPAMRSAIITTHGQDTAPHGQLRERCKEPLIALGLFRAAAQYSREQGIPYWYFLTTSALARALRRMNVQMAIAGTSCLHNGERHPFWINVQTAIEGARHGSALVAQMLEARFGYRRYSEFCTSSRQLQSCAA